MELIENLFMGYPNLWGGGVAHSVLILSLVITIGIALGKVKVAGVSLGITWILFVGIIFGHFNMNLDEHLLHFLKEFGLILFVYSIGLQVGPGFFSAFKKGGLTLNMVAMTVVFSGVILAVVLHFVSGVPITTMVGILSGAVTNTPGLGAAQQANSDLNGVDAPEIALGYAVAYPLGVIGCILSLWGLRYILRRGLGHLQELTVRPVTIEIHNESVIGKKLRDIHPLVKRYFVVSHIYHADTGTVEMAGADTVLNLNDKILLTSAPVDIDAITVFLGCQAEMNWDKEEADLVTRSVVITRSEVNGKMLSQLKIRNSFGANVIRVNRSGVDLVASPNLQLQIGDRVMIVGNELAVGQTEKVLGNSLKQLNHPNLIPIFLGIALGCILGSIPFVFPGIPQPVKLGLAGGPLIVSILISRFGHHECQSDGPRDRSFVVPCLCRSGSRSRICRYYSTSRRIRLDRLRSNHHHSTFDYSRSCGTLCIQAQLLHTYRSPLRSYHQSACTCIFQRPDIMRCASCRLCHCLSAHHVPSCPYGSITYFIVGISVYLFPKCKKKCIFASFF